MRDTWKSNWKVSAHFYPSKLIRLSATSLFSVFQCQGTGTINKIETISKVFFILNPGRNILFGYFRVSIGNIPAPSINEDCGKRIRDMEYSTDISCTLTRGRKRDRYEK